MNGGFGMVLDGTPDAQRRAENMLFWDVYNGVARRAWAGNDNAQFAVQRYPHPTAAAVPQYAHSVVPVDVGWQECSRQPSLPGHGGCQGR